MSIPFEQSSALAALPGVRHGFFGRQGGVSEGSFASANMSIAIGDDPVTVDTNRVHACAQMGRLRRDLVLLKQVHSSRVVTFTERPDPAIAIEADAMVTRHGGLLLGILTADCTPILLADPVTGTIGAVHAGWKGAIDGIVEATVRAMTRLGAGPERIVAAVGPTISGPNYEVGADFAANVLAQHPSAVHRILKPEGGVEHFDLPGFVADQLRNAGVGHIHDMEICTYAGPERYFSHRRATHQGSKTGRQIALIGLA